MRAPQVHIVGGGPAGAAAAIAALMETDAVRIFERSPAARHKVCGEFIPAEAYRVLEALGAGRAFLGAKPARIARCALRFGSRQKLWTLSEPAFSLSRFELDRLLLDRAAALGATVSRGESFAERRPAAGESIVVAHGRHAAAAPRGRLFGFKAHFAGPIDDTVELHFTRHGYAGISAVENGFTNICGIAPEEALRGYGFDIDEFLASDAALGARLRPLARQMPWLKTGPLVFARSKGLAAADDRSYPAGDALGFIDPFTGSGILNALLTGRLAGIAAAREIPSEAYLRDCRALLDRPFAMSGLFRFFLGAGLSRLALLVPGEWLYRLTRARGVAA
jgi:flavin-dependent dehydrogenase